MITGAAEEAQPADAHAVLLQADILAAVELLGRILVIESAALDETYAKTLMRKAARDGDSRGARADNAQVRFERRPWSDAE